MATEASQSFQAVTAKSGGDMEFGDILGILRSQAVLIIAVTAVSVTAAIAYALRAKPVYMSTTKMFVQNKSGASSSMSALAQFAGVAMPGASSPEPSEYFPDLLEDEAFLKEILERKWVIGGDSMLLEQYWQMKPDTTKPNWRFRYEKEKVQRLEGEPIKIIKGSNGLILLTTYFGTPELTWQINNFIVGQLDNYLLDKLKSNAKQTRLFVEMRLGESEKQLIESEHRLAEFLDRNQGINSPRLLLQQKQLQRSISVNQEIFLELKKQFEMARIEEQKNQPLLDIISKATIPVDKHKPNRRQIAAAGLFIGLFLSVFAAFFRHWLMSSRSARPLPKT